MIKIRLVILFKMTQKHVNYFLRFHLNVFLHAVRLNFFWDIAIEFLNFLIKKTPSTTESFTISEIIVFKIFGKIQKIEGSNLQYFPPGDQ